MNEKTTIKLAIVSTYPPTECGIATYTKTITDIIEDFYLRNKIKIVAVDRDDNKYNDRVMYKLNKLDQKSYIEAAEKINKSSIEIVSLQHEYGLYGGDDGKYILHFLEKVKKPVVTTMHSVLTLHSNHRFKLTKRIIELSQAVIVMTEESKKILVNYFKVKNKKIYVIPHGGPNVRPESKDLVKQHFGFKNKTILSTFGLINPGKGIEYAIKALKNVVVKHPDIMYLIIGITHPDIQKRDGETYRKSLEALVSKYNLQKNIKFINKYLDYKELVDYLKATDIYLAPQLDLYQAVSGTIAYALCCDNAIISSSTQYAKEVLASGRGIIVKEKDSKALENAINSLLDNPEKMEKIKFNAYSYARNMIFPRTCLEHLRVFEIEAHRKPEERYENQIVSLKILPTLRYIQNMTTELGMVQHAKLDVPDLRFGYSIDDQSRALIAIWKYCMLFDNVKKYKNLIQIYLKFIDSAAQKDKYFHNFMDQEGNFIDEEGSEDSYGRTMWSLGYVAGNDKILPGLARKAKKIFYEHLGKSSNLHYIRAKAYVLLGLCHLKENKQIEIVANQIVNEFNKNHTLGWQWFEDGLFFANAIIPYTLARVYKLTKNKKYLDVAIKSFKFLDRECRYKNIPAPIGQDGWYTKNGKKALFDQQAIDAADMVLCAVAIYGNTKQKKYIDIACDWFGWFYGNNIHKINLYDYATGGCYDGITKEGVNLNEGAESVLVYLLAYLKIIKSLKTGAQ